MSNWTTDKFRASDLTKKIKDEVIKVPHYQRGQVWKEGQKEKLIDSIKKGFPFGTILLYKKEDNSYQLIDGLQRSSTIYEYLHSPAKFFKKEDITDSSIEQIYDLLHTTGNEKAIKEKVRTLIQEWVISNHQTMEDVKNINDIQCARYLQKEFPNCNSDSAMEIASILKKEFQTFRSDCEDLSNVEIPAIIYYGTSENLPEVFKRINSKGTTLSKYQILSATWTTYEYVVTEEDLFPIIQYVDKFYTSIIDGHFGVDGYDQAIIHETRKLNLYQLLFGFSKLLSFQFPYLFIKSKNDREVESCAFNLINSCLGNKNSKVTRLPIILEEVFNSDEEINKFLLNIIKSIENVYKILKPYLEFKLNKRVSNISCYHTELQICSMIANYFNARYATYTYDSNDELIGRSIKVNSSNETFDDFQKDFKKNAFKRYLIDIINDNWRGSGDARMDEVSLNNKYYTNEFSKEMMLEELDHWINQIHSNRHEVSKVLDPKNAEKIMLSVIYSHSFTAFQQNDDINYDIEHLAPKGCLKILLKKIPSTEGGGNGLPISSFANLCLLREEVNRVKKDKTLYQDTKYLTTLKDKNISLNEIEDKFSFTTEEDLNWMNHDYTDFNTLKNAYFEFLHKRFDKQKELLINNLYPDINAIKNLCYQYSEKKESDCTQQICLSLGEDNFTIREASNEYNISTEDAKEKLSSWQKDIYDIINGFYSSSFTLNDLYRHCDELKKLHPDNNTIQARIRATLQELRDLRLIEFAEKSGNYKRLWR